MLISARQPWSITWRSSCVAGQDSVDQTARLEFRTDGVTKKIDNLSVASFLEDQLRDGVSGS